MTTPDAPHTDANPPATQDALPFVPLPFCDEVDEPVPFHVTARGRKAVVPESLPQLRVVDGAYGTDEASDTRAARARALRRAGVAVDDIAVQLKVDPLLAQAWTADVPVRTRVGQRRRGVPVGQSVFAGASHTGMRDRQRHDAYEEALLRVAIDPQFAVGLGLLSGVTFADEHGVTLTSRSAWLLRWSLDWLQSENACKVAEVRVVLKIGSNVAGDLARQQWAFQLGVERSQCTVSRWRYARDPDDVEAVMRVGNSPLATRYVGWIDALKAGGSEPMHEVAQ